MEVQYSINMPKLHFHLKFYKNTGHFKKWFLFYLQSLKDFTFYKKYKSIVDEQPIFKNCPL